MFAAHKDSGVSAVLEKIYLACGSGSQAVIATLLFDPSMSALPTIESQRVELFTYQ